MHGHSSYAITYFRCGGVTSENHYQFTWQGATGIAARELFAIVGRGGGGGGGGGGFYSDLILNPYLEFDFWCLMKKCFDT